MPNVIVKVPQGTLSLEQRHALCQQITHAVATAEQIPDVPHQRMLCWVLIEEVPTGSWTCGGMDMASFRCPSWVVVHVPAGVLDASARQLCVRLIHAAFEAMETSEVPTRWMTSITVHEVPDGHWGANGSIWSLSDFVRNAGYQHLQPHMPASTSSRPANAE